MEFVADLHVHSHYSRATGRELDLEHLWIWAQRKGVTVVGTGDFTHPAWFAELEQKLVPAEDGLFSLRADLAQTLAEHVPTACTASVRFMLTAEISNIYKRDERTRKVHNLVCLPDLASVAAFNRALSGIGNLKSDGRPILGLDSRDLLEMLLSASERAVLIPAHIWTPWFSVLGSKSGFDSIEACYRDLSSHIFAVETGLSSDPPMNWRLSALDRYALISNSDAHSLAKLAREANLFSCPMSYEAIFAALRHPQRLGFEGTLEFFPEEGKYHLDGHRKCNLRFTPEQTHEHQGKCPVCGKPLTLGVMYRVEELADRPSGYLPERASSFKSLIGLSEVLGEALGTGSGSKSVERALQMLSQRLGSELYILRQAPAEDLCQTGGPILAEAVRRMRAGEVHIEGGYDGEFGTIHLLEAAEREQIGGQTALFTFAAASSKPKRRRNTTEAKSDSKKNVTSEGTSSSAIKEISPKKNIEVEAEKQGSGIDCGQVLDTLDSIQYQAATHSGTPVIIVAGPGTGKTRTLTARIAHRIQQGTDPRTILAITFTNQAAAEMRHRLQSLLGNERAEKISVFTFHALALHIVNGWRQESGFPPLRIIDETERLDMLATLLPQMSARKVGQTARDLSIQLLQGESTDLVEGYRKLLLEKSSMDLDALVGYAAGLLNQHPFLLTQWRERSQMVCLDEYQDINKSQYELVRLLCPVKADLCVIGDPDQAIYAFRGADSRYFLRFSEDFPEARRFTLEQSYRTGSALLEAAQQMIRHNPERLERNLWSKQLGRPRVEIYHAPTAAAEAEFMIRYIEQAIGGTTLFSLDSGRSDGIGNTAEGELSFADFAVLFRLSAQADLLREAFDRSGIPYRCSSARPGQKAATPILDFFRVIQQPSSNSMALPPDPAAHLVTQVQSLAPVEALPILIAGLCSKADQEKARHYFEPLLPLIYGTPEDIKVWAPLLLSLAASTSESDELTQPAQAVSLLTLHASKGLEFPVVLIAGLEEGLLPHYFAHESQKKENEQNEDKDEKMYVQMAAAISEERRLMYVGMTRAQRVLVLTYANKRPFRGMVRKLNPSRFLTEIPDYLKEDTSSDSRPFRRKANQLSLF